MEPNPQVDAALNDTLNDTPCVAWKPRARPSFQHLLETQVAARHIKTSRSPCRRSIPQALVRDTHTWHHCVLADPLLHDGSMRFDKHPFETQVVSWHIKTSHSPSRRSIPQAPTRDEHQRQHTTSKPAIPHLDARFHKYPLETNISGRPHHIKTSHSPSRRSIPQAPSRDARQWHDSTSKSAFPN